MPEEVESNMFWSIAPKRDTVEPEPYEEEAKEYWLTVSDEEHEQSKPFSINNKKIPNNFEKVYVE